MRILFAGPSLARRLAQLRQMPELVLAGPCAYGDIARATLDGANAIGLVDGRFEDTRAVWHKEILFALSRGVMVAGAASMGALRAAECSAFGMVGIGAVFRNYADGTYEDDADVAQLHGPAELGYMALSEPLANILPTLDKMASAGIIDIAERESLAEAARALHYKERTYARIFQSGKLLASERIAALLAWVAANKVDQKESDAMALVDWLIAQEDRRSFSPAFTFSESAQWLALLAEIAPEGEGHASERQRAVA
jgi:hypothetical protein